MGMLKPKGGRLDYFNYAKFAIGGTGFTLANVMVNAYLTFFCTDIFGVSPIAVAGLLLVSRIIDAITDPIMGLIADHTKTRWGKYRPYLIVGAPILGVIVYLLFSAPNLTANQKVIFLYIVYIAYSLAFTMVTIPHQALVPIIGKDTIARSILVSWKNVSVQIGRMIITTFALPLVEIMGGGTEGWGRFGAVVGVGVTMCYWCAAWGAKKYDIVDCAAKKQKVNLKSEFQLVTKNTPLIRLMIAYGTDTIANTVILAINIYYFKYVMDRMDLVPITAFALTATGIISNLALPLLNAKFGKKQLYLVSTACCMIPLAALLLKPVMPATILVILITVFGLISTLTNGLSWAMLPDCVDYAQHITGTRGNAVVSATFSFMTKCAGAIGGFLTSFLLSITGFVANQEQAPVVLTAIVVLRFGVPILGYIASLLSMWSYELTDAKCAEIRKELNQN
ncbi:sugar (glycoside-pentoside-Hexuronide) transporter [Clostridium sp. MCC353]|nr:sugar (glycoside-pentoside-Hexuronide) transporter [Clostridium sp. MCC353]